MSSWDSETPLYIEEVHDIQVKNFGFIDQSNTEYTSFHPNCQTYHVTIYPNGTSSEYNDYVSIYFEKITRDPDPSSDQENFQSFRDSLSWTLSIVDANNEQRFYQSFAKEHIKYFPYCLKVDNFMKRSSILNKSDELLPEGVLTIRCELFYRTYSMPIDNSIDESEFQDLCHENHLRERDMGFWMNDKNTLRIELHENFIEISNLASESDTNTSRKFRDYRTVFANILEMLKALIDFQKSGSSNSSPSVTARIWREELKNRDPSDEVIKTHMTNNPIFQLYERLKRKINKFIAKGKPLGETTKYDDVFAKFISLSFTQKILQIMKMFESFCSFIPPPCEFHGSIRMMVGQGQHRHICSPIETERNYVKEVVDCILSDEDNYDDENQSGNSFLIETKEGETFILTFKNNEETLGSKLLENSIVFKRMFENPMKEKHTKKVTLPEVDFETFLEFLNFIQFRWIDIKSFSQINKLYRFADMYEVQPLTSLCSNYMIPFFTENNAEQIQMLAELHLDNYLSDIVNLFEEHNDDRKELDSNISSRGLPIKDKPEYVLKFDFYQ
ncbi:uncharacterized protein CDAR_169181 [Caerostris darwini]|uniref:MATH domain-containing protein n=1 Tax=Caerostris darwini TaxID=1538125 RepID=A0AAV4WQK2_9ARAC|nr:uncharacterized protein CDAR_169181 [Caerostris darwini]